MKKITSKDNSVFKYYKKLQLKKYRDIENKYLVFGQDLVDEAIKSNNAIQIITSVENDDKADIYFEKKLFDILQGNDDHKVGALIQKREIDLPSNRILVLDNVQDPSNVGTLLRSALGFGFNKVVRSKESCDFYNEKTIRASKGSISHLSLLTKDLESYLNALLEDGYTICLSEVSEGDTGFKRYEKVALVLGNEGSGIGQNLKKIKHQKVHINTTGVESLNVSVAGSILMYELSK